MIKKAHREMGFFCGLRLALSRKSWFIWFFDLARAVGGNSPSASLSAVILAQAGIQPAVGWALMAVRIKLKAISNASAMSLLICRCFSPCRATDFLLGGQKKVCKENATPASRPLRRWRKGSPRQNLACQRRQEWRSPIETGRPPQAFAYFIWPART